MLEDEFFVMINVLFRLFDWYDKEFEVEDIDDEELVRCRRGRILNFGGFILFWEGSGNCKD